MPSAACAMLIAMNPKGHSANLVAEHPGNTNALRSGAHSPRLIEARAAEIVEEIGIANELDAMGKVSLWTLGRQLAVLEFMEQDLSERGFTDRNGKERYLIQRRERNVRLANEALDRVLEAQARARKQLMIDSPDEVVGEKADYVRALQQIALDRDPEARVPDRLTALKLLLDLGAAGTTHHFLPRSTVDPYADDAEIGEDVARLQGELEDAKKRAHLEHLRKRIIDVGLDAM